VPRGLGASTETHPHATLSPPTRHGASPASTRIVGVGAARCSRRTSARAPRPTPAPVAREFRGVWVATVGNIDWPSKPGLSSIRQQDELLQILDRAEGAAG
jgi:uncharacterized lipoprotein YddW (UPF0748 family)